MTRRRKGEVRSTEAEIRLILASALCHIERAQATLRHIGTSEQLERDIVAGQYDLMRAERLNNKWWRDAAEGSDDR